MVVLHLGCSAWPTPQRKFAPNCAALKPLLSASKTSLTLPAQLAARASRRPARRACQCGTSPRETGLHYTRVAQILRD